jgi:microcystin-dependent protein
MGFSAFKLVATGADGKSIRNTHSQDNHPFKAGQVVRFIIGDGGGWTAASATDAIQAEATGIIEEVVSGSEFTVVYQGEISTTLFAEGYGVTGGGDSDDVWFLSAGASAGRLENVAPTEGGNVIKPMLIKQKGDTALVTGYIGTVIGGKNTVSIDQLNPVGTILPYAGVATDIPSQWALCDGQPILVSEFGEYYRRVALRYGFYQTLSFGANDTSIVDLTDYLTTGTIKFEQAVDSGVVTGNVLSWDNDTKKASVDVEYLDGAGLPNGKSFDKDKSVTVKHTIPGNDPVPVGTGTFNNVTNAIVTHAKTPDLQGRIPMGVGNYNPTNSDYVLGEMGGLDELILTEANVNTTDVQVGDGSGGSVDASKIVYFPLQDGYDLYDASPGPGHPSHQWSSSWVERNAREDFGELLPPETTHLILAALSPQPGASENQYYRTSEGIEYFVNRRSGAHSHGWGSHVIVPLSEDGVFSCKNGGAATMVVCVLGYVRSATASPGNTITISEGDGGSEAFSNIQPFLASNYIIRTKAEAAVSIINTIDIPDNSLSDHNTPTPQRGDILAYYHDGVAGTSGEYRNFKLFEGITADGTDEGNFIIDIENERLGIGHDTPTMDIDIRKGEKSEIRLNRTDSDGVGPVDLVVQATSAGGFLQTLDDRSLYLGTATTNAIQIQPTALENKVQILTSLEVDGSSQFTEQVDAIEDVVVGGDVDVSGGITVGNFVTGNVMPMPTMTVGSPGNIVPIHIHSGQSNGNSMPGAAGGAKWLVHVVGQQHGTTDNEIDLSMTKIFDVPEGQWLRIKSNSGIGPDSISYSISHTDSGTSNGTSGLQPAFVTLNADGSVNVEISDQSFPTSGEGASMVYANGGTVHQHTGFGYRIQ